MGEPEVVCGPVLRRAEPAAVGVFLALRSKRKVTLRVYGGEGAGAVGQGVVLVGTAETVRLGERLHVVTVVAAPVEGGAAVAAGADLRYQVFLGAADGTAAPVPDGPSATTLASPGVLHAGPTSVDPLDILGYGLPGRRLPGFQVAPDDPAALRVLHGGERTPDGAGRDALASADRVVRDSLAEPVVNGPRPHALVLAGDQVRADEPSALLLAVIRAAAAKWGLVHDRLPGLSDAEQPAALGPHRRVELAGRIGLRPAPNHLLSFAEHIAIHLLVLSDAAWPALPTVEQVHPDLDWTRLPADLRAKITSGAAHTVPAAIEGEAALFADYARAKERITAFRASLPAVRRLVANVPVLTALGEHDAAPGWNASRAAATKLIGAPAGKRVLANALSAAAVVQAWGNTPEQFTGTAPGAGLLTKLATWLTAPVPSADGAGVDELVGVPSAALARPAGALTYAWATSRPRWQLLFTDTQTDRAFPAAAADPAAPLRDQGVLDALGLLPAPGATTLTVVVTSVPLLLTPPQETANPTARPYSWTRHAPSLHFTMTKLVTEKVAGGAEKKRTRRVLVLTGGQGHGSAARLRYSAKAPGYGSGTDAVEAVVAQVTAAPAHGTTELGLRLHTAGYRRGAVLAPWRDFVGWDQVHPPTGAQKPLPVGVRLTGADRTPAEWTIAGRPQLAEATPDHTVQVSPHWAWHADYVRSSLVAAPDPGQLVEVARYRTPWERPDDEEAPDPDGPSSPAGAPPAWNLARYRHAAHNHAHHAVWWAAGSELVGENALGDLTFAVVPAPPAGAPPAVPAPVVGAVATVRAAQWWWAADGGDFARRTRFDIDLEPRWGWYDGDRYDGRALRRGDFDATAAVAASYWGVRQAGGKHVRDLQKDLVELGFAIADRDPDGKFEQFTQWAVREFQIYARSAKGAREKVYTPATKPTRYLDRLEPVDVPTDLRFDRPENKVTGVVDRTTRRLIAHWVANRWRCPVVIEALPVAGGVPGVPTADAHSNLWHHTQPGIGARRAYATDYTGRYAVAATESVAQPASTDAAATTDTRPRLVILSGWTDDLTVLVQARVPEKETEPATKPRISAQVDGGQLSKSDTMWRRLEMKPETMLVGNPTLADLVAAIATPAGADDAARTAARLAARRRLSTYKVVRAVAEVEAIGYFDGINGYDNAFLSMGPCHWTMGKFIQKPPSPALGLPGPHTIPVDQKWGVEEGEFWGYLAFLEHAYPDAHRAHYGADGTRSSKKWADSWDSGGRKYTGYASLETGLAPTRLDGKVLEYDYFHSWHNFYRMLMAVRTDDDVRRAMYRLAGQRVCDILAANWPQFTEPDEHGRDATLPTTTPPGGAARRPRIGELVTSELGVALIYRWHILSPGTLFSTSRAANQLRSAFLFAKRGQCPTCDAAKHQDPVDPWLPAGAAARTDPNLMTDPLTWGDAHEHAMVAGILHRAKHHKESNMASTIEQVRVWPRWFTSPAQYPTNFTLEISALPHPGAAGVDAAVFPVSERSLKLGRGTFLLDSASLPYPDGRAHTTPGGGA